MTCSEYRGKLWKLGLTPAQLTYEGGAIYRDRDGEFHNVPDPEKMTPAQRVAMIALLEGIIG